MQSTQRTSSTTAQTSILLIEDDETDAECVQRLLAKAHPLQAKLTHCLSLAEGLELLDEQAFDILLLDLGLPGFSQLESLETLREEGCDLPIIVLTGNDSEETGVRAVAQGAQDFLCKDLLTRELLVKSIRYSLERYRLMDRLQEVKNQLLNIITEEQLRIARDIHDSAMPLLGAADLGLLEIISDLDASQTELANDLAKVRGLFHSSKETIRRAVRGLEPPDLKAQGFGKVIHDLAERTQQRFSIATFTTVNPSLQLHPLEASHQLYLITQEALYNAVRHAAATQIVIGLQVSDRQLILEVNDNGKGMQVNAMTDASQGLGLRSMCYRGAAIGGQVSFVSKPNQGTHVRCVVPRRRLRLMQSGA